MFKLLSVYTGKPVDALVVPVVLCRRQIDEGRALVAAIGPDEQVVPGGILSDVTAGRAGAFDAVTPSGNVFIRRDLAAV
jgi:hypothetical protein